jgi:D-glycero-D-manno-heptose 1,7-bisphosphate phosphatase
MYRWNQDTNHCHNRKNHMFEGKIKTRAELRKICSSLKTDGKTIGFTSGAFDLLHAGHVDYLNKAKQLCDVLVVGVNSNSSVLNYKTGDRPIIDELHRIKIVAALASVDFAFLFKERRNRKNIEALQPDFYIKADDYKPEELTSGKDVEKYGGEVLLIPIEEIISTTAIIKKIESGRKDLWVEKEHAVHLDKKSSSKKPAVFLDRDGTINDDVGYLHDPIKLKIPDRALQGIKKLYDMGYHIIIVTNQPGIGIGYFSEEDFYKVNRAMLGHFSRAGILVDKIYFCPHSKAESCDCRKPEQALIQRAIHEMNLDMAHSFFIGDKTSDMETGRQAGIKTILVKTGLKGEDREFPGEPDYRAEDLLDAAEWILKLKQNEDSA